jgi:hypothetical protein
MHCYVYASLRKPDTYVWMTRRDGFDMLPEPLVLLLGEHLQTPPGDTLTVCNQPNHNREIDPDQTLVRA